MQNASHSKSIHWGWIATTIMAIGLVLTQTANPATCSDRPGGRDKPLIMEEWAWGHDVKQMEPHPEKKKPTIRIGEEDPPIYFWFRLSGCGNHLSEIADEGKLNLEVQWEYQVVDVWILRSRRTPAHVSRYTRNKSDNLEGFKVELETRGFFDFRSNAHLGEHTQPKPTLWRLTIFHKGQPIETADGEQRVEMRVAR